MHNFFADYHPVVNFLFFASVMIYTMIFTHPVYLGISICAAVLYALSLKESKTKILKLKYMVPIMLAAALMNPLFNHRGVTILTYFPNGNPLTLESIIYGFTTALMLTAMLCWFSCYNTVVTSDKFLYLFGRIMPTMALFISIILRFIPLFSKKLEQISNAQKCLNRDISKGKILTRIKNTAVVFSIMVTWMLENAIDTADSMKSRGYGLRKRTSYSVFIFSTRDKITSLILILTNLYLILGILQGEMYFRYFPAIKGGNFSLYSLSLLILYLLLCLFPLILNGLEEIKWTSIKSKI